VIAVDRAALDLLAREKPEALAAALIEAWNVIECLRAAGRFSPGVQKLLSEQQEGHPRV